jgi:hypothetical protein
VKVPPAALHAKRRLHPLYSLVVFLFLSFLGQAAMGQNLENTEDDSTVSVEVTVVFGDDTGISGVGVDSWVSADMLDPEILLTNCYANPTGNGCWLAVGGELLANNEVAVPSLGDDCNPVDYDNGDCGDATPISITLDVYYPQLTPRTEYEILGAASLGFFDANGNDDYWDLVFSQGLPYVPLDFIADVPSNLSLSPSYGVLGTSGQLSVTGDYLIDPWGPPYKAATPPAVDSGLSFTVASPAESYPGPTDNTITVNYSITSTAPTGNRQFTLTNRFGTSSPVAFIVADASPTFANPNVGTLVAGNQYSINISGANFGKNPQVFENGPAGVAFNLLACGTTNMPPGCSTPNTITGTITLASGASTGPIIITLTSQGASGNGFVGPETPTVTATGIVQGLPAGQPSFVLRPSYASAAGSSGDSTGNCSSNTPLTSTNAAVVVGQQINLTACAPANSGISVQSATWTPPPSLGSIAVGGFSVTMSTDGLNNFTEAITAAPATYPCSSTGSQSCDFPTIYFLIPGTYTFQYQYTLTNGSTSPIGNATFVVSAPSPETNSEYMSVHMLAFEVWPAGVGNQGNSVSPWLQFGNGSYGLAGITFTVTAQPPSNGTYGGTGTWQFVQLLGAESETFLEYGGASPFTIPAGLDTLYPYPSVYPTVTQDSPGLALEAHSEGEAAEVFQATMYLLWDPQIAPTGQTSCSTAISSTATSTQPLGYNQSTCASIPVPLQSSQWESSGGAIKTLNPNQNTNSGVYADSWYLSDGATVGPQTGPGGFPTWTFTSGASKIVPAN